MNLEESTMAKARNLISRIFNEYYQYNDKTSKNDVKNKMAYFLRKLSIDFFSCFE